MKNAPVPLLTAQLSNDVASGGRALPSPGLGAVVAQAAVTRASPRQANIRERLDRVRGAAIDLDEDDEVLSGATRFIHSDGTTAGKDHTYAEHLAGAFMAVEPNSLFEKAVE